jgi:hypothetical protein
MRPETTQARVMKQEVVAVHSKSFPNIFLWDSSDEMNLGHPRDRRSRTSERMKLHP